VARTIDVPRAVQNFDFFADAVTQFSSEAHPTDEVALNYTLRQPLGAVACISPWNLPLYVLTWKIARRSRRNCVVAKPSEVTPMTGTPPGRSLAEAGLSAGVLTSCRGWDLARAVRSAPTATSGHLLHRLDARGGEIARESAASFRSCRWRWGENPTLNLRRPICAKPFHRRCGLPSPTRQICLCGLGS